MPRFSLLLCTSLALLAAAPAFAGDDEIMVTYTKGPTESVTRNHPGRFHVRRFLKQTKYSENDLGNATACYKGDPEKVAKILDDVADDVEDNNHDWDKQDRLKFEKATVLDSKKAKKQLGGTIVELGVIHHNGYEEYIDIAECGKH
jgi:hypothetical protein